MWGSPYRERRCSSRPFRSTGLLDTDVGARVEQAAQATNKRRHGDGDNYGDYDYDRGARCGLDQPQVMGVTLNMSIPMQPSIDGSLRRAGRGLFPRTPGIVSPTSGRTLSRPRSGPPRPCAAVAVGPGRPSKIAEYRHGHAQQLPRHPAPRNAGRPSFSHGWSTSARRKRSAAARRSLRRGAEGRPLDSGGGGVMPAGTAQGPGVVTQLPSLCAKVAR